ncbi:MAG: hypothetical protein LBF78_15720 [Treponema sp.]|jgi:hypothetical protein|nr:hypothetical protein [Treponema sp.]
MNKTEATIKALSSGHTVFLVDWWSPGARYPDGDIVVEAVKTIGGMPKNWNRGDHYCDYFTDAELAYRYAENIQAELGIKALFGTYESYKRGKEAELRSRLEVEEIETRRFNSQHGRL